MNTFQKWVKAQGGPTPAAKLLGLTRQTINNWLSGRSRPTNFMAHYVVQRSRTTGPRININDLRFGGK